MIQRTKLKLKIGNFKRLWDHKGNVSQINFFFTQNYMYTKFLLTFSYCMRQFAKLSDLDKIENAQIYTRICRNYARIMQDFRDSVFMHMEW